MPGFITNRLYVEITRPEIISHRRHAVAQIRIQNDEVLNFEGCTNAIHLMGLRADTPHLAFEIYNFYMFYKWIRETKWTGFAFIEEPFDFTTVAMFELLNGFMSAPADATSGELTEAGLSRLAPLGDRVKRMPKGQLRRSEWPTHFRWPGVEMLIRYDADQRWVRRAVSERKAG